MKNLLLLLALIPTQMFAMHNGGTITKENGKNNPRTGKAVDTFSINCLVSSSKIFYGAELGEKHVMDKVDSLVSEIDYQSSTKIDLVIVSAKDLGFINKNDIQWNDILDSAVSRGYMACPAQAGPELYVMAENRSKDINMPKLPTDKPIFIGMPEIRKTVKHKFMGISRKQDEGYIFCLKAQGINKAYKLGYCATNTEDKSYFWTSADLFVFAVAK